MIKICAVSYLNTKPFLKGIEDVFAEAEVWIRTEIPSVCVDVYNRGWADIALVPSGALSSIRDYKIMDSFCIGAERKVDSVFICSQQALHSGQTLILDSHSRTSNLLAEILIKNHWQLTMETGAAEESAWMHPEPDKVYVIIGDKAVLGKEKFAFVYDMATEWWNYTGLPFVFAVWIHRYLDPALVKRFQLAFEQGLEQLSEVAAEWGPVFGLTEEAALRYFSESISYRLDTAKQEGLRRFQEEIQSLNAGKLR